MTQTKDFGATDTGLTLDFVFRVCTGHDTAYWAERCQLDHYSAYTDPREDSGKGILVADWNHFPRMAANSWPRTEASEAAQQYNWGKGRKFQTILERMGYQLEWSDQITRCDDCGGCIQTDPGYYGDIPQKFDFEDGSTLCGACIVKSPSDYLEALEDNPRAALGIRGVDLVANGYKLVAKDYENGFHPGQDDNPSDILATLTAQGYSGVVFKIDDAGQFDVHFSAYAKEFPAKVSFDDAGNFTGNLPSKVVEDCAASGDVTPSVVAWRQKLGVSAVLEPLRDKVVAYLREYGAWDDLADADMDTLADRVLWLACCDINESGEWSGLVH